jgi:flagellar hook-associated protein 3 FlgL
MVDRISTSLAQQLGINNILFQQSQVNQTQLQISSGKRILTPSDDPAGAAQLLDLSQSLSRLDQFQSNLNYAENRLSLSEVTLQSVTENIHRVRELAVQGFNATNSASDKESIALEMFERLDEIVSLANTKDSNGDYIYAGFQSQTEPFSGSAQSGTFTFNGDQGERYIKIGENRTVTDGNSGAEVFENILDKNGQKESIFETFYGLATDLANNRSAAEETVITLGAVVHAETVTLNGINYHFDDGVTLPQPVTAADATNIVVAIGALPTNTAANLEAAINANDNSVNTQINGDDITITAVTSGEGELSVSTLATGTSATTVSIPLYDHLSQIDTALERILNVRSQIGARLNVLESQSETNLDFKISIETTKAQIEDLDIAEAISRFNQQIVGLQAAQQSFVKTQNLSLFNLL